MPTSVIQHNRAIIKEGQSNTQTLVDLVGYVPANFNIFPWPGSLAKASDFTTISWTKTRSSISTGILPPVGVIANAQRIVPSTANGTHLVAAEESFTLEVPIPMRVAIIARAAGYTRIVPVIGTFHDNPDSFGSVGFDLVGGNVGYDVVAGAAVVLTNLAMVDLGEGWWLCTFDYAYTAAVPRGSTVYEPELRVDNGSGTSARSISFTGDGTSGVDLWWFNFLPKAAWDLTSKVFEDDFDSLATIDLANTKVPGFKWYINNLYQNSFMPTFGWETNPPSVPSDPNWFTISSPSILKIYSPGFGGNAGWDTQLWSTVTNGAGGVVGYSHKPPLVYDGYLNWDGSEAAYNPQWSGYAAFWGVAIEAVESTSISGMTPTSHWNEWDISEAIAHVNTSSLHDWSVPADPVRVTPVSGGNIVPAMVLGEFRRLSGMWLRPEDTGTDWGIFLFFRDGHGGGAAYKSPDAGSGSDQHHMNVILNSSGAVGSGNGQAFYIDWVKVYTKP